MIHSVNCEINIHFLKFYLFHEIFYINYVEAVTVSLAKSAPSFPLNSLSPPVCVLGHPFFLYCCAMFDLLTTQRQMDSLSNFFILLGCKLVRNTIMSVYVLFLIQPCLAYGHSYFENDEDDGEKDDKEFCRKGWK